MTGTLDQGPSDVVDRARALDPPADPVVNLALHDTEFESAALGADGYEGPNAASVGLLAAGLALADSDDGISLHFGDVDVLSPGPWLVLAPLDGFLATVSTGRAAVTVTVSLPDTALETVRSHLDRVLDAARLHHDHYPVGDDPLGVFRTGMTTFSVVEARVDDGAEQLDVDFEVSTTPATTAKTLRARFTDGGLETVKTDVDVDVRSGVERATPATGFRTSVEAAHRAVVGDAQYEWLSDSGTFAQIPSPEKVALGGGTRRTAFSHDDYEQTRKILRHVVDSLREGV